jgi:hypothetical protein
MKSADASLPVSILYLDALPHTGHTLMDNSRAEGHFRPVEEFNLFSSLLWE